MLTASGREGVYEPSGTYATDASLNASGAAMQFTVSSSTEQQVVPFCLGYVFRQGDVPAGQTVVSNKGALQVTPKNTWPDGSLKFAVLCGRAYLASKSPMTISLEKAACRRSRSPLTTADLRRTSIRVQVSADGIGCVSWLGIDWERCTETWISGPEMSSWIYRRPLGIDAQLVVWLEVRLFADGTVEVQPWIENGSLPVVDPTLKTARVDFSLGGRSRFNALIALPPHMRTPLIQDSARSYWWGNDPAVVAQQDQRYLQSTALVPRPFASNSSLWDGYAIKAKRFAPMRQGDDNLGLGQIENLTRSSHGEPMGRLRGREPKSLPQRFANSSFVG